MTNFKLKKRLAHKIPKLKKPPMLMWTDPPFGTGKIQRQTSHAYDDRTDSSYYVGKALAKWTTIMDSDGVICICLDYRAIHDVVVWMKTSGWVLRGEIIWEFGLGRPRTSWWPNRHNTIVTFTRTENSGKFDFQEVPRVARRAKKKGYEDDKPAGSVWWYTMSNTDSERVGYPNQKPIHLIAPFILAHTSPDDLVVDPFMGSGSTGVAALTHNRKFWGGDTNPEAISIAHQRLERFI